MQVSDDRHTIGPISLRARSRSHLAFRRFARGTRDGAADRETAVAQRMHARGEAGPKASPASSSQWLTGVDNSQQYAPVCSILRLRPGQPREERKARRYRVWRNGDLNTSCVSRRKA